LTNRRTRLPTFAIALVSALIARGPDAMATEASVGVDVSTYQAGPASGAHVTTDPTTGSDAELVAPPVSFDKWRGMSFGSYLAPKENFVAADGGVDVVFHFHAGQMAERQMKESGMNAVFVSCGYGIGSGAYSTAFASPQRFENMLAELMKNLETQTGKKGLHVRKLALASWSAGFAAIGKILSVDRYYAMVDSVILNDSLHSQYLDPNPKTAAQGAERVDLKMIGGFIRFAKEAVAGRKTMVITHSGIIPPDYASSTEATQALLTAVAVQTTAVSEITTGNWSSAVPMTLVKRADAGNLHVRGFKGGGPRDHFQHLYLLGEVLRSWVVPRWKRSDRLVYTLAGEQL
jgi:hypothetical protein